MSNAYNLIPEADYVAACEAIREKTGKTALIKSGELATEIRGIPQGKPEQAVTEYIENDGEYVYTPDPGKVFSSIKVRAEVLKNRKGNVFLNRGLSGMELTGFDDSGVWKTVTSDGLIESEFPFYLPAVLKVKPLANEYKYTIFMEGYGNAVIYYGNQQISFDHGGKEIARTASDSWDTFYIAVTKRDFSETLLPVRLLMQVLPIA